jgi:glycosyltransferase involved in cell wall biosynthesis
MCRALQDRGVDILIATTNADGAGELPVGLGERVSYQNVSTIFFERQWSEALKFSLPLALWMERNGKDFDLVHIHAVFSHACVAAANSCRKRRTPYLVRPLGTLDPWSLKQKPIRKRLFWHLGVKQMLMGAAAVHYTSAEERRSVENELGLSKGVVVPNGIDLSFVTCPREPFCSYQPALGDAPYILALSRIHPKKGFELLIESLALLKGQGRFSDWRLVFAGDGDPEYVDQLKNLAQRKGLGSSALFVGWLEGDSKYAALRGASLLAMPSYQENFGISLIEAMACGVPVLVSPHVNLAPDIEKANAGWVTALKEETIAAALADALSDERERRRRGECGRELAQRFDVTEVAADLITLYESLIGDHR